MELSRPVALDRVGPQGITLDVEAGDAELQAVARRLGVPSVQRLGCTFRVRRIGPSLIEAQGTLHAAIEQVCVVSLDAFVQDVQEAFTVHFVPSGTEDDDAEPDAVDQIPYEGSVVDLGEATVEQLALALDPYPRKPGAILSDASQDGLSGPFAALAGRSRLI